MSKRITKIWEWFKEFFNAYSVESMMRLLNFMCVFSGNAIIWFCALTNTIGFAHYGLELAILGVLGKGYQEYNIRQKENGKNIRLSSDKTNSQG